MVSLTVRLLLDLCHICSHSLSCRSSSAPLFDDQGRTFAEARRPTATLLTKSDFTATATLPRGNDFRGSGAARRGARSEAGSSVSLASRGARGGAAGYEPLTGALVCGISTVLFL